MPITVHCGPMFAGKTEALIAAFRAARHPLAFKPAIDTRHARDAIVTHAGDQIPATAVCTAGDLLSLIPEGTDVVCVDEAQFFGPALIAVARRLSDAGTHVVASCLDLDAQRLPFGVVGDLLALADTVTKHSAHCARCQRPARYTCRLIPVEGRVFVGGAESYEPRCPEHWRP